MMDRAPAGVLLVVFEHGKIDHPQRFPLAFLQVVLPAELGMADLVAQCADRVVDDLAGVGTEEDQVAVARTGARQDRIERGVVQVLHDRRLQSLAAAAGIVDLDVGQPLGAVDRHELGVAVDLAAGQLAAAGHAQADHPAALHVGRAREHLEVDAFHRLGEIGELQLHPQVGLVRTVQPHRFGIRHGRKLLGQIDVDRRLEHRADHLLEDRADLDLGQERGFAVDLGELRLPVGAQVFIAKALGDLVVAIEARHHQQLLEQLGRLRQREEMAGMHPRRHQVIARALRRGLGEHRRFDVDEAVRIEKLAHLHRHPVAQHQVVLHLRAAQIEHPVSQPGGLGQVFVVELERRRHRGIEDLELLGQHLDRAAFQLRIDGAFRAPAHLADHLHAEFVADPVGGLEHLDPVRVAHHLGQALAIAQIDEDHPAMIAAAMNPAEQRDHLIEMGGRHEAGIAGAHDGSVLRGAARCVCRCRTSVLSSA